MSPFDSESRIAAQLAPFTMVALMPYFLKKPFSCATTTGEQSVSAIMPKRRSGVSGPSPAAAPDADGESAPEAAAGAALVELSFLQAAASPSPPIPAAANFRKSRR